MGPKGTKATVAFPASAPDLPSNSGWPCFGPCCRGDNVVAIDLITEHIRMKLQQHDLRRIYANLEVMPTNFQIRGMHTIIRDHSTNKADFVFYSDRLLRLVVEAGLGHLHFAEKTVVTPTGHQYVGVDFAKKLCGVSIIRSGESMENALRACCKGIKIGKILVHRCVVVVVVGVRAGYQSGGSEQARSRLRCIDDAAALSSALRCVGSLQGGGPRDGTGDCVREAACRHCRALRAADGPHSGHRGVGGAGGAGAAGQGCG